MSERRDYTICMPLASGAMPAGQSILLLECGVMGDVYFAQQSRLSRREGLKILSTGDLIPDSCVRSGRAGPAGNYTWGADHYPQLVR
jgi:hypothetical protein